MLWLHIIQYLGFGLAQITNSVLIYLIGTKAEKLFGSYRHVMFVFAMYSIIYAWIEVATSPIMHIKGPVFIVIMDSPLQDYKAIGMQITFLYCGSFAAVISLLAVQFFYRYVAICREEVETCYDLNSTTVPFIAPMYWFTSDSGEITWNILDCLSALGCVGIISTCFSTILYCAHNIYASMKKSQGQMSAKTLELNRQLFITLTFQTLLPFIMMYSPVGLLMTLPLFEVYVGKIANFVAASLAVYPGLNPLLPFFASRSSEGLFCVRKSKESRLPIPLHPLFRVLYHIEL